MFAKIYMPKHLCLKLHDNLQSFFCNNDSYEAALKLKHGCDIQLVNASCALGNMTSWTYNATKEICFVIPKVAPLNTADDLDTIYENLNNCHC